VTASSLSDSDDTSTLIDSTVHLYVHDIIVSIRDVTLFTKTPSLMIQSLSSYGNHCKLLIT